MICIYYLLFATNLFFDGGLSSLPCLIYLSFYVLLFLRFSYLSLIFILLPITLVPYTVLNYDYLTLFKSLITLSFTILIFYDKHNISKKIFNFEHRLLFNYKFLNLILFVLILISLPFVDNFFYGLPRLSPFSVDPNIFGWSFLFITFSSPFKILSFTIVVITLSLSCILSYLIRNNVFILFSTIVLLVVICLLFLSGAFVHFFENDLINLKLLSLEHRVIRSLSVFTNSYQFIGLNPHISIAAGFLKIGPIAFLIFIYYNYLALLISPKFFLLLLLSSFLLDVYFGPISLIFPFLFKQLKHRKELKLYQYNQNSNFTGYIQR